MDQYNKDPIDDDFTRVVGLALSRAVVGVAPKYDDADDRVYLFKSGVGCEWRGYYGCCDGKSSTNHDYLLENGMITNSLAVHYLRHFRVGVPESELGKVAQLMVFYDCVDKS